MTKQLFFKTDMIVVENESYKKYEQYGFTVSDFGVKIKGIPDETKKNDQLIGFSQIIRIVRGDFPPLIYFEAMNLGEHLRILITFHDVKDTDLFERLIKKELAFEDCFKLSK